MTSRGAKRLAAFPEIAGWRGFEARIGNLVVEQPP